MTGPLPPNRPSAAGGPAYARRYERKALCQLPGSASPSSASERWAARPPGGWRPAEPRSSATTASPPGHDRSAAGGETRIFRSAHFEDSRYVPLLKHADALWEQLQQETGRELRRLTGCLLMGPTEHQQMATVLESIAEHGLDHEVLDAEPLAKRFPQFRIEDGDAAVLDRRAGFIRPELTDPDRRPPRRAAGRRASTATRTVREIVPVARRRRDPHRRRQRALRHRRRHPRPVGQRPAARPAVGGGHPPPRSAPGTCPPPTPGSARSARRSSGPHPRTATACPPRTASRSSSACPAPCTGPRATRTSWTGPCEPEELEIFTDLIGRYLPDLHPDPTRLSVYMEGYTESSRPLVGPLPGAENVVLLAGFSGHGFKLSPAFGDIAADLALDGTSPQPIDFISTARPDGGVTTMTRRRATLSVGPLQRRARHQDPRHRPRRPRHPHRRHPADPGQRRPTPALASSSPAGVHGGEFTGIDAATRLAGLLDPARCTARSSSAPSPTLRPSTGAGSASPRSTA